MRKKGIMLSEAFSAVLTLVLVAILVIISIYLFSALQTSISNLSGSATNETGGYINATGYTLTNANSQCGFTSPGIVQIYNASSKTPIASGNYTLTGNVLYNATATTYTNVTVSYSYLYGGQTCNATTSMISNFSSYPTLVGLVGTIIFLAVVIGVLVASFAFGKKGV